MMYTQASASDYDDFQAEGWKTKELIPLMKKYETYQRACNNRDIHGFVGPSRSHFAITRTQLCGIFFVLPSLKAFPPQTIWRI